MNQNSAQKTSNWIRKPNFGPENLNSAALPVISEDLRELIGVVGIDTATAPLFLLPQVSPGGVEERAPGDLEVGAGVRPGRRGEEEPRVVGGLPPGRRLREQEHLLVVRERAAQAVLRRRELCLAGLIPDPRAP